MLKQIKKRFLYVLGATIILMILGLIFIGAGKITFTMEYPGFDDFSITMNGFDAMKSFGIDNVLSSSLLKNSLTSAGGLGLIRCGIVFAVIFTPMLGAIGIGGSIYDFMAIKNNQSIKNEEKIAVTKN